MNNNDLLFRLTGLSPEQVGETLLSNPRAYMALKGAVAEKHLHNMLTKMVDEKKIYSFRKGIGDFEKDFYIKRSSKDRELALECKNVQVINISTFEIRSKYLRFLLTNKFVERFEHDLDLMDSKLSLECIKSLSIELRESGLARYSFSKFIANVEGPISNIGDKEYLKKFSANPISIDFQRTRNSRDGTDEDNKSARFYQEKEIDLVGACLFSRTLEWDFVFCSSQHFERHKKFKNCYSNSLILHPEFWQTDLSKILKSLK